MAVIDKKILFGYGGAEKTDEGSGESQGNGIESLKIVYQSHNNSKYHHYFLFQNIKKTLCMGLFIKYVTLAVSEEKVAKMT